MRRPGGLTRRELLGLGALGAAAAATSGCRVRTGPAAEALPPLRLAALGGGEITLAELCAGRPALLDFFATWCPPCRKAAPRLRALAGDAGDRGLLVLGVAVGEPAQTVRRFATELRLDYPILLDADFALADLVGASRVPTYLVTDEHGRILHRGQSLDRAERAADRHLAARPR